jgi:hypothetical protein
MLFSMKQPIILCFILLHTAASFQREYTPHPL